MHLFCRSIVGADLRYVRAGQRMRAALFPPMHGTFLCRAMINYYTSSTGAKIPPLGRRLAFPYWGEADRSVAVNSSQVKNDRQRDPN